MVDDIVAQYLAAHGEVWRATQHKNVPLINAAYDIAEDLLGKMTPEQHATTVGILRSIDLLIDKRLRNR